MMTVTVIMAPVIAADSQTTSPTTSMDPSMETFQHSIRVMQQKLMLTVKIMAMTMVMETVEMMR